MHNCASPSRPFGETGGKHAIFLVAAIRRETSHWAPVAQPPMNRRKFLLGSASFVAASAICRRALGQGTPPGSAEGSAGASVAGQLSIVLDSPSHLVPENFT